MSHKLGVCCKQCGNDSWFSIDDPVEYAEFCDKCCNYIIYNKARLSKEFRCEACGSTEGVMNDDDDAVRITCKKCNTTKVVLQKYSGIDNRDKPMKTAHTVCCPRCGGTQITTSARGVNGFWGFIGASKTVNRCANCGKTWEPKR